MKDAGTIAIIGVGLIGASIGLAVRRRGLAARVIGIGRNTGRLQEASDLGAVTDFTTRIDEGVADARLVVVCTPVDNIVAHIRQAAVASPPSTLLTDAGSTKALICRELAADPDIAARFVGSHPMAGSEKSGARHGREDLFVDRVTVVTPDDGTPEDVALRIEAFWRSLGAQVLRMTPDAHDAAVAAVSHTPHVVASALAAATPRQHLPLAGSGWSDTTRVAAGEPGLWRQILLQNRRHVLKTLDDFAQALAQLRSALDTQDAEQLEQRLDAGRQTRDAYEG